MYKLCFYFLIYFTIRKYLFEFKFKTVKMFVIAYMYVCLTVDYEQLEA